MSKRFGIRNQWARHWVALPSLNQSSEMFLGLANYLSRFDELGEFQYRGVGGVHSVRCVRPFEIRPQVPPGQVLDTSNAFLCWRTQVVVETDGLQVDLPSPSRWDAIVEGIRFYTHNQNSPLEVRRFAMGSEATLTLLNGQQIDTTVHFVESVPDPQVAQAAAPIPVAVGFAISVDGVCIRIRIPDNLRVDASQPYRAKMRALRTSLFRDRVIADPALDGIANSFRRQWLAEVYLSALVYASLVNGHALSECGKQHLAILHSLISMRCCTLFFRAFQSRAMAASRTFQMIRTPIGTNYIKAVS